MIQPQPLFTCDSKLTITRHTRTRTRPHCKSHTHTHEHWRGRCVCICNLVFVLLCNNVDDAFDLNEQIMASYVQKQTISDGPAFRWQIRCILRLVPWALSTQQHYALHICTLIAESVMKNLSARPSFTNIILLLSHSSFSCFCSFLLKFLLHFNNRFACIILLFLFLIKQCLEFVPEKTTCHCRLVYSQDLTFPCWWILIVCRRLIWRLRDLASLKWGQPIYIPRCLHPKSLTPCRQKFFGNYGQQKKVRKTSTATCFTIPFSLIWAISCVLREPSSASSTGQQNVQPGS